MCSFLLLYRIPLYEYATIYLFTLQGHFDCFQFSAIMNNTAMNTLVCVLLFAYAHISVQYLPKNEISMLLTRYVFSFSRYS